MPAKRILQAADKNLEIEIKILIVRVTKIKPFLAFKQLH